MKISDLILDDSAIREYNCKLDRLWCTPTMSLVTLTSCFAGFSQLLTSNGDSLVEVLVCKLKFNFWSITVTKYLTKANDYGRQYLNFEN